ncbi:MAG: nucleotide-binding protein [Deltaproteobacteria bacterium]|nr:nucleotide-binding protein [Deltaproteobacteria bacterium]
MCSAASCALQCSGGSTKCGNGCVDTKTSPAHCGACNNSCPPGQVCSAGACALQCVGGTTKCGSICVDTKTSPAHCGGCNNACPSEQVCANGGCTLQCVGGTTNCAGGCVDTNTNPAHCGGCNNACPSEQVCANGGCTLQCVGGTTNCGGSCVDTKTNLSHCGGCNIACGKDEICSGGSCALICQGGLTKCGSSCVDVASDPKNCGSCGNACAGGDPCTKGKCGIPGGHLWSRSFGTWGTDYATAVAVDSADNVLLTGYYQGSVDFGGGPLPSNNSSLDIFIAKYDKTGKHLWSKRFGNWSSQYATAVAVDAGGGVCLAGYFQSAVDFGGGSLWSVGGGDLFVAKLDKDGNHLWSKRFGDASGQNATGVANDGQGGCVVTGYFAGAIDFGGGALQSNNGSIDVFVASLDKNGGHQWSKRFGDWSTQQGRGVASDLSGNAILTGTFLSSIDLGGGNLTSPGSSDVYLAKYDAKGAHLWSKRFGDWNAQAGWTVTTDGSENVLALGDVQGTINFGGGNLTSSGSDDIYLAKLDKNGGHLWSKRFGDASIQNGRALCVDAAGNVFLGGFFQGSVDFGAGVLTSAGSYDALVAKLDKDGNALWSKRFGDGSEQYLTALAADSQGNVVLAGYYSGSIDFGGGGLNSAGSFDLFVAKLKP